MLLCDIIRIMGWYSQYITIFRYVNHCNDEFRSCENNYIKSHYPHIWKKFLDDMDIDDDLEYKLLNCKEECGCIKHIITNLNRKKINPLRINYYIMLSCITIWVTYLTHNYFINTLKNIF